MIENKFLYFLTYADFKEKLDGGHIDGGSVVFIEDKSIIWTHNKEFVCTSNGELEQSFNAIWDKLEEITGLTFRGVNMYVSPERYFGESCVLTISADSANANGIFQRIKFIVNGDVVKEMTEVKKVHPFNVAIEGDCDIVCEATVLGQTYTMTKHVANVVGFWVGSGASYEDAMTEENLVDISQGMRVSTDVQFTEQNNLYIVMDNSIINDFIRADMNGFEIPLDGPTAIENTNYSYFVSQDTFLAGTYNIDING